MASSRPLSGRLLSAGLVRLGHCPDLPHDDGRHDARAVEDPRDRSGLARLAAGRSSFATYGSARAAPRSSSAGRRTATQTAKSRRAPKAGASSVLSRAPGRDRFALALKQARRLSSVSWRTGWKGGFGIERRGVSITGSDRRAEASELAGGYAMRNTGRGDGTGAFERTRLLQPAANQRRRYRERLLARVSPSDMQPGRSGTVATNPPPSSSDRGSITTA